MTRSHRVLVVGTGSIGERHTRCFLTTDRCRVSICEPVDAARERVASAYNVEAAYSELDEALGERFDAAVIATPAPLHIPIAARIAAAGSALLIEKPLAADLAGIDELRGIITQRAVGAAVGYVHRSRPCLERMREAIASGRFGAPVQVTAIAGQHFPTYRPAYREVYYRDHAMGGGAIQDALTHLLNAGEWLVGPIVRVVADGAHQVLDGVDVEDTAHVLARHQPPGSGQQVLASYALNQYQAPGEISLTVVCEAGTTRADLDENAWRWMIKPEGRWITERSDLKERDDLYIRQAHLFLDYIEGLLPEPPCTIADGLQTLRVNLAALASVAQGGWVDVPWEPVER